MKNKCGVLLCSFIRLLFVIFGLNFCLLIVGSTKVNADSDRYWVGDGGYWSDQNHWSETSGGAPGATVPTLTNNVFFDEHSFTLPNQTVVIDQHATVADMNWTDTSNNPTLNIQHILDIYDSMTLIPDMTIIHLSVPINFLSNNQGQTITLANKWPKDLNMTFYGNGDWSLQDDITFNLGYGIKFGKGTLNTNGKTITGGLEFLYDETNPQKTLLLSNSIFNCTKWRIYPQDEKNITIDADTSTINMIGTDDRNYFYGGGKTYNTVNFLSKYSILFGENTFENVSVLGDATRDNKFVVNNNQVIHGTLTLHGNSVVNRLLVGGGNIDSADALVEESSHTISAQNVDIENVDFQDITASGEAAWTGTSIGDALGNSGITFDAPVTRYWIADSGGNWSDTSSWSSSSGGAPGAHVPLPQDTVLFDSHSISSNSRTITVDMPRLGADVSFAGVLHNPEVAMNSTDIDLYKIFGSLNVSGITITGSIALSISPRSTKTLTNGNTLWSIPLYLRNISLEDDLLSTDVLVIYNDIFNTNNHDLTATSFVIAQESTLITINMGSSTWTATGNDDINYPWSIDGANITINSDTSTIQFTDNSEISKTFDGGGKSYHNVLFTGSGTGAYKILGSNTFADFKVDTPPHTVLFEPGSIQTVDTFTVTGLSEHLITLNHSEDGDPYNLSKSSGIVGSDYLDISNSIATGGAVWYAGAHSNNTIHNTGWIFSEAPTPTMTPSPTVTPTPTPTPSPTPTPTSQATSTSQNTTGTASFTPAAPFICSDQTPGATPPWIYTGTARSAYSILLHFTPAEMPVDKYVLEYGTTSGQYTFGVLDMGIHSTNQMSYLIGSLSPNTTYYFRIRAGNGCATGPWSNEISVKTNPLAALKSLTYTSTDMYVVQNPTPTPSRIPENSNTSSLLPIAEQKPAIITGYDVRIQVLDTQNNPVKGATVTIHSTPQTTKTNDDGIAIFQHVESGTHTVAIAYEGYNGEQSIHLTGDVREFNVNIKIQKNTMSLSPLAYSIISMLGFLCIILFIQLFRRQDNI
jgi:hypothetical protein